METLDSHEVVDGLSDHNEEMKEDYDLDLKSNKQRTDNKKVGLDEEESSLKVLHCNRSVDNETNNDSFESFNCSNKEFRLSSDEKHNSKHDTTCSGLGNQLFSMYEIFTFCTVCEKAFHDGFRYKVVPLSRLLWECADSEGKCKAGIKIVLPAFLQIGKHVCQENIKDSKVFESFFESRITVFEENCELKQFKKKFILTRYTKVETVSCLESEICRDKNEAMESIVYCYKKNLKEMVRYMGYEYVEDLPKLYTELGQYKCSKGKECPAIIRFLKGIAISQAKKHTCDQLLDSKQVCKNIAKKNCKKRRIYSDPYSELQGIYIIYGDDTEYVPEIDSNSTLKYHRSEENKLDMVSYMGYKYVINSGTIVKIWSCQKNKSCSAILKIAATDKALLQLEQHICNEPNKIENTTNSITSTNELVSNFEPKPKCNENNVKINKIEAGGGCRSASNVANEDLESENLRCDDTIVDNNLNKSIYLHNDTSEHGTNEPFLQWNNANTTNNCYEGSKFNITKYSETQSTRSLFVPDLNNDISGNTDTKGLVNVTIIDYSFQDVPPDEQTNYEEILKSDKYLNFYLPQVLFRGHKHFKERDCLWPDEMISCPCINKHSLNCPGMVQMKQDKIIYYMGHWCKGDISQKELPQLDPHDTKTVLLYNNISVAETEALYNGFKYIKYLKTCYYSVYQCTEQNCHAEIKLFLETKLLTQIRKHTCTFNNSNHVRKEKKSVDVDRLPEFVFEDEDEPFLIYKGYLYNQVMTETIWSCVETQKNGCKGLLHMKNGTVTSVSKHTCLTNKDGNTDLFLFQDRRTEEKYAMHLGNIYKRSKGFSEGLNKKLWNCLNNKTNKCPGVLTTIGDKVVTVLNHLCSHKDHIVEVKDTTITSNVEISKYTDQDETGLKKAKIDYCDYEGHNLQDATRINYSKEITPQDSVVDEYKIVDIEKEQSTVYISNHRNMLTRQPIDILKGRPIPVFQDSKSFLIYNGFIYCPLYYKNNPMKTYLNWVCFNYQNKRCTGQIYLKQFELNGLCNYYASYVSRHTCSKYFSDDDLQFFQSTNARKTYASYRGCLYEKYWALNRNQNIYRWNCLGRKTETCRGILTTKNNQVIAASAHNCNYKDHDGAEGEKNSCTGKRQRDTEEIEDDSTDLNVVNYSVDTVKTFAKVFKQEDDITIEETYIKNDCDEYNVLKVKHALNQNMVGYCNLKEKHNESIQHDDDSVAAKLRDFIMDKLGRKRKLGLLLKCSDPDTNALKKVNVLDFTCQDINSEEHNSDFPYNQYLARYSHYYPKQLKFRSYTYLKQLDTRLSYETCVYVCSNKDMQNCPGLIRLQYNKMLEYIEHSCISGKESVNLTLTLHKVDPENETIIFYKSKLSGEKEALVKCYTFSNLVDRDYSTIWTCVDKKCTAVIKIFPLTCLLREFEKHTCSLASHPFITCCEEDGSNDNDQAELIHMDEIWDNTTDTGIEIESQIISDSDDIEIKPDPKVVDEISQVLNDANVVDKDVWFEGTPVKTGYSKDASVMDTEACNGGSEIKTESLVDIFKDKLNQDVFEDKFTCSSDSYAGVNCKEEIDVDLNALEEKYCQ